MAKEARPKRPVRGRVFQCTGFPNCNKAFTRSEHLARHRRKHTGERPFTCTHCSKNFSRLDNLRQHKQTVHAFDSYVKREPQSNSAPPTPSVFPGADGPKSLISPPPTTVLEPPRQSMADSFPRPSAADTLRVPPTFKPKVRPQPLSLAKPLNEETTMLPGPLTAVPVPSIYGSLPGALTMEPALRTAPSAYFGSQLYEPVSAFRPWSMSSSMVSPLSPLFHQSFNQVARPPRSDSSSAGLLSRAPSVSLAPIKKHLPTTPVAPTLAKQVPTPAAETSRLIPLEEAEFRKASINNLLSD